MPLSASPQPVDKESYVGKKVFILNPRQIAELPNGTRIRYLPFYHLATDEPLIIVNDTNRSELVASAGHMPFTPYGLLEGDDMPAGLSEDNMITHILGESEITLGKWPDGLGSSIK